MLLDLQLRLRKFNLKEKKLETQGGEYETKNILIESSKLFNKIRPQIRKLLIEVASQGCHSCFVRIPRSDYQGDFLGHLKLENLTGLGRRIWVWTEDKCFDGVELLIIPGEEMFETELELYLELIWERPSERVRKGHVDSYKGCYVILIDDRNDTPELKLAKL